MTFNQLIKQIKLDYRGRPDLVKMLPDGSKLTGYGHLITKDSPKNIQKLKKGDKITEEQIDQLLVNDIAEATKNCVYLYPNFPNLDNTNIILYLVYSLGIEFFLENPDILKDFYNIKNYKNWDKRIALVVFKL